MEWSGVECCPALAVDWEFVYMVCKLWRGPWALGPRAGAGETQGLGLDLGLDHGLRFGLCLESRPGFGPSECESFWVTTDSPIA